MSSYVKKFYTSDTHFGHEMIIGLCGRPFSSVEEMDAAMVNLWNDVVGKNDIVYHLGDFCFGSADYAAHIFHQLHGRKILILGNHDVDRKGQALPHLAALPWDVQPTPVFQTTDEGKRLFLSHYAHRQWPGSGRGSFHFYGHSHGQLYQHGPSRDVGVDLPDVQFQPKSFKYLTADISDLPAYHS